MADTYKNATLTDMYEGPASRGTVSLRAWKIGKHVSPFELTGNESTDTFREKEALRALEAHMTDVSDGTYIACGPSCLEN